MDVMARGEFDLDGLCKQIAWYLPKIEAEAADGKWDKHEQYIAVLIVLDHIGITCCCAFCALENLAHKKNWTTETAESAVREILEHEVEMWKKSIGK